VVETHRDALANAPELADGLTPGRVQGRVERADEERAVDPDGVEAPSDDPRLERLDINGDVRQLGHARWDSPSLSVAKQVTRHVEVISESIRGRESPRGVVDDHGDLGLVERAVGAQGRWQGFELGLDVPEDGVLVAEDDELADPVGHQVESP